MRIISYNVNGIRAAIKKGFIEWVEAEKFDIIGIQESKAHEEQVNWEGLKDLGYTGHWHSAERRGYSGVTTFSKQSPDKVVEGCGIEKYDREGRILRTDFGELSIINCYFPSGSSGEERHLFKMDFLADFFEWITDLKKERPNLIIMGDYNVVHTAIDIHNPKKNQNTSGFKPEERAWMTRFFESGFVDSFRELNPDTIAYSWWSYRANARNNNKGWRIDYHAVSEPLKDKLLKCEHLPNIKHSDHCPVLLEIDWTL